MSQIEIIHQMRLEGGQVTNDLIGQQEKLRAVVTDVDIAVTKLAITIEGLNTRLAGLQLGKVSSGATSVANAVKSDMTAAANAADTSATKIEASEKRIEAALARTEHQARLRAAKGDPMEQDRIVTQRQLTQFPGNDERILLAAADRQNAIHRELLSKQRAVSEAEQARKIAQESQQDAEMLRAKEQRLAQATRLVEKSTADDLRSRKTLSDNIRKLEEEEVSRSIAARNIIRNNLLASSPNAVTKNALSAGFKLEDATSMGVSASDLAKIEASFAAKEAAIIARMSAAGGGNPITALRGAILGTRSLVGGNLGGAAYGGSVLLQGLGNRRDIPSPILGAGGSGILGANGLPFSTGGGGGGTGPGGGGIIPIPGGAGGGILSSLGGLGSTTLILGGLAAAIGVAGIATVSLADHTGKLALEQRNLAQETGLTIKQVGLWSAAAEINSVNIEALSAAMRGLSSGLTDSEGKGKSIANTLELIGISAKTSTGEVRPINDILVDLSDRLRQMSDLAGRDILDQLFGRGAKQLLPLFRQNVRELLPEMEALGSSFSDGGKKALEYENEVNRLGVAWSNLKRILGEKAIGLIELTGIVNFLTPRTDKQRTEDTAINLGLPTDSTQEQIRVARSKALGYELPGGNIGRVFSRPAGGASTLFGYPTGEARSNLGTQVESDLNAEILRRSGAKPENIGIYTGIFGASALPPKFDPLRGEGSKFQSPTAGLTGPELFRGGRFAQPTKESLQIELSVLKRKLSDDEHFLASTKAGDDITITGPAQARAYQTQKEITDLEARLKTFTAKPRVDREPDVLQKLLEDTQRKELFGFEKIDQRSADLLADAQRKATARGFSVTPGERAQVLAINVAERENYQAEVNRNALRNQAGLTRVSVTEQNRVASDALRLQLEEVEPDTVGAIRTRNQARRGLAAREFSTGALEISALRSQLGETPESNVTDRQNIQTQIAEALVRVQGKFSGDLLNADRGGVVESRRLDQTRVQQAEQDRLTAIKQQQEQLRFTADSIGKIRTVTTGFAQQSLLFNAQPGGAQDLAQTAVSRLQLNLANQNFQSAQQQIAAGQAGVATRVAGLSSYDQSDKQQLALYRAEKKSIEQEVIRLREQGVDAQITHEEMLGKIRLELERRIAEERIRETEKAGQLAGGLFDAVVNKSTSSFFRQQALGLGRTVVENFAKAEFNRAGGREGLGLTNLIKGQVTGEPGSEKLTLLGQVLQGTPFGARTNNTRGTQEVLISTEKAGNTLLDRNNQLIDRLNNLLAQMEGGSGSGSGGGGDGSAGAGGGGNVAGGGSRRGIGGVFIGGGIGRLFSGGGGGGRAGNLPAEISGSGMIPGTTYTPEGLAIRPGTSAATASTGIDLSAILNASTNASALWGNALRQGGGGGNNLSAYMGIGGGGGGNYPTNYPVDSSGQPIPPSMSPLDSTNPVGRTTVTGSVLSGPVNGSLFNVGPIGGGSPKYDAYGNKIGGPLAGSIEGPLFDSKASAGDRVASGVGTAGVLYAGYQGIAGGIRQGGAYGTLGTISAATGTAAALDPEPISKAVLATIAVASKLAQSILGDPRKRRQDQITKELAVNQYLPDASEDRASGFGNTLTSTDKFGRVRSTTLSDIPQVSSPYIKRIDGTYIPFPSQVTSNYSSQAPSQGGGGNVIIQTMDSASFQQFLVKNPNAVNAGMAAGFSVAGKAGSYVNDITGTGV